MIKSLFNLVRLKLVFIFCLFSLVINVNVYSQTDFTLGTGTVTNDATTYPCPLQDFYEGCRMQYLYRASELTAAGMTNGNILGIKYTVTNLNLFAGDIPQFTMKIGNVTANVLTLTNWETVSNLVYGPVNYVPTLGVNSFVFATPFLWDGTSNIVIEICNGDPLNNTFLDYTENVSIAQSTLAYNCTHSYRADNLGNLCASAVTTNTGSTTARPNIIFSWMPDVDCAGTPVAGTATGTPSVLCLGQSTLLSTTGTVSAGGLLYQWYDSTAASSGYAPIVGATTKNYSTTQLVTTWYKLKVKCTFSNDSSYSTPIQITTPPVPGGNYTINKAAPTDWPTGINFNSFNDAYNAVKCGISSAVIFNVLPGSGPYSEQLIITGKIPNSSATNTITFNGNNNFIQFSPTNTNERAVIKLKGAKYFIFDSLRVDATVGTYGIGFHLINDADSNIIRKCSIYLSTTNITAGNTAGIAISGTDISAVGVGPTLCDGNEISKNFITGGYYGITQTATFAGGANGRNVISGNTISDFYRYGIYTNASYNCTIEKNKISRQSRTNLGAFDGIYFTGQSNNTRVIKNRIFSPFAAVPNNAGAFIGINLDNAGASATNDYLIENNLIYDVVNSGTQVGLSNIGSGNVQYIHNTISLDDDASTSVATTRGYNQSGAAASIVFINNLISIGRGGAGTKNCIYVATLPVFSDNNNFYINSVSGNNNIGFFTSNRSTLQAWQNATLLDVASISIQPVYFQPLPANDTSNYSPTNAGMDNKGFPIGTIDDINSQPRDPAIPDIGCYEFIPPPCVPGSLNGVTEIRINNNLVISDTTVCENTTVKLGVKVVGPFGSAQTFQWERVKDLVQTPINFSSPMLLPDTTFETNDTSYYYRCKISCLGIDYYTNWRKVNSYPAMIVGNHYINSAVAPNYIPGVVGSNFNNYDTAIKAMRYCGIKGSPGNVVFNVVALSGPYLEQIKIDSILGANFNRQVVFKGNYTTLSFPVGAPSVGNERAIIKLKAADFINFDSLIIDGTTATNFGYGIQLLNNADSNSVKNCIIKSNDVSVSQNFAGIVVNSTDAGAPTNTGNTTLCDGNIFDKNIITGGYIGISLAGGTATGIAITDNTISNNSITDFFNTGVYVAGTRRTIVDRNLFSRPIRTNVNVGYGVNFANVSSFESFVSNNRFTSFYGGNPTGISGMYGIHFNGVDATTGNENIVYNNAFYNLDGLGFVYPLYNNSSDNVFYYHNSIAIDNPTAAATGPSAGFYQTVLASGIRFKNNIIHITRGGNALKHCINLTTPTTAAAFESNTNVLFVDPTVLNGHVGALNGNKTTLPLWQISKTPQIDSLSFNYDPLYENPTVGNLKPQFYLIDNKAENLNIPTDILDLPRTGPDIGAWEFTAALCPTPLIGGTASVTPASGICLEVPIRLNLSGNSPVGQINFQWQDSIAGGVWQNLGPVKYSPIYDTVSSIRNFYRCIVTCAATGISTISSVAVENLNIIMPAGTYTIDSSMATNYTGVPGQNFNTFIEAITEMKCGILGSVVFDVKKGTYNERVRVPYIAGTSPNKTITFQGFGGISTDKIISWGNTYVDTNYVLRFDSCTYVTFKDLTIENTNANFGRVVEFVSPSSNDKLLNCTIKTGVVFSTSNVAAAVFSSPTRGKNITIKGNTISNGANGIYFAGTSIANLALPGHLIDSNFVSGTIGAGIFVQFANRLIVTRNNVSLNGSLALNVAGIYSNYCDTSFLLSNNKITINSVIALTNGIHVQNSRNNLSTNYSNINGNEVYANTGNTGRINGIYITASEGLNIKNNVIGINSADSLGAYGLVNFNNINNISYYNNTVNITAAGTRTSAAQITQTALGRFTFYNNILANNGGGRAMFMNNIANITSDYNMLFSTGNVLVNAGAGVGINYGNIRTWKAAANKDKWSMQYHPSFITNEDLRPDLTNPDVWAMHGRANQIKGNITDINGNFRPDSLTIGVPDLGAYEFFPTALPTVLTAIPAIPVANTEQTFHYGSDTVMKIKWSAIAPPSIEMRRYSGVVPPFVTAQGRTDSMYFYNQVNIPGGGDYEYNAKLFYIEPWLGSVPKVASEYQLGLGKTTAANAWVVGFGSRNDVPKKMIYQNNVPFLDKFTGLVNPYSPPPPPCKDTSNRGKEFWVAYPANQLNGTETYQIYLSATEAAYVTIEVPGTGWVRTYNVPANSVVVSDIIPGAIRHQESGKYPDAIRIISDVDIVAYAHTWGAASSAASMLIPTCACGYEYNVLTFHQNWGGGSFSSFFFVADKDNTKVYYNATAALNNGVAQSDTIVLNRGEWFQGIASSGSDDLSGTYVKSVLNDQGKCYPVAMFSGDTRTLNNKPCGGGGDFSMQQNFPSTAWGKKYLTAPTSQSTGATSFEKNLFRISIKDPTTIIRVNGTQIYPTGAPPACVESFNYNATGNFVEFQSICANYIQSDKPIMVAQFLSGACAGVGDPEMMYISPIEQGINDIGFYRNTTQAITFNVLTLIGSTIDTPKICEGSPCLTILWSTIYPHPNYPGKSVYVKHWAAAQRQVRVTGDSAFTAITYGLGSVESYGYNAGTLVKNLLAVGEPPCNQGVPCDANPNTYTCSGTYFQLTTKFPLLPDSIRWKLSGIPGLTPNQDIILRKPYNPPPIITPKANGEFEYKFTLAPYFITDILGNHILEVKWWHPDIEGCDKATVDQQYVQVIPSPKINFTYSPLTICPNTLVNFIADAADPNSGIIVKTWNWTSNPYGLNSTGKTTSFNYTVPGVDTVKLHVITADYCVGDSSHPIIINPLPVVDVVKDSINVCMGASVNYSILNPIAGAIYSVYTSASGGTAILSGNGLTPLTIPNITSDVTFYIECVTATGCTSINRKLVKVTVTPIPVANANPITQIGCIGTSVTFNVTTPISGAIYTWFSDATAGVPVGTGTSLVINPVLIDSSYYLEASVNGCISIIRFKVSLVAATTPSLAVVSNAVSVCSGDPATFSILNPDANVTYNWYTAATGGTAVTGTNYIINSATTSAPYFVSATSINGCTSSPRLQVNLTVIQRPVVTVVAPNDVTVCKGTTQMFTVLNPVLGAIYNWYNVASSGAPLAANTITFTTPPVNAIASYYVDGTSNGCVSISRATVKVTPLDVLPKTVVTATRNLTDRIIFDWTAITGAVKYEISINGGTYKTPSSGSLGLTHTESGLAPGDSLRATVQVSGLNVCQNSISDTAYGKTVVNSSYYPNAFTPNGDGRNDKLVICGSSIKDLKYIVFNQWGEKIWEATNLVKDALGCYILWDGTHKGVLQPSGVYMYASRIVFLDGKIEEKAGSINLIR